MGKTTQSLEKFREVQDAYKVLSTPELKIELDKIALASSSKARASTAKIVPGQLRFLKTLDIIVLCSLIKRSLSVGSAAANIYDLSHSHVKKNFEENVLHNASSNWSENLPKYKTEGWRNLPLAEKKVRSVNNSVFFNSPCLFE